MRTIKFGIIGNMGPEADELFQKHIRRHSNAKRDQEHLSVTVIKNPDIPDRTDAIIGSGENPVPEMVSSARDLEHIGVQFAVMPCNTAHYFRDAVQRETSVYILDMLDTVISDITSTYLDIQNIGLLATTGTIMSGIYETYAEKYGLTLSKPSETSQEAHVHSAIYGAKKPQSNEREPTGIKSGIYDNNALLLTQAIRDMGSPSVVILGCTELPLVSKQLQETFPDITFIDPMEATAKRAIHIYREAEEKIEKGTASFTDRFRNEDLLSLSGNDDISSYIAQQADKQQRSAKSVKCS